MKLVSIALSTVLILAPAPAYAAVTDVLPALEPVHSDLSHYDTVVIDGRTMLRFTGTVANHGPGPLEVIGRRGPQRDNTMTAYQRIKRSDGSYREQRVGTILYHEEHHHYHLDGVSRYRLLDAAGTVVRSAPKVTFCLTDTEQFSDGIMRPMYIQCTPSRTAPTVTMGISSGWMDIYPKDLPGQSFDITGLPPGQYTLEMTTNPLGLLVEAHQRHPAVTTVRVTVKAA